MFRGIYQGDANNIKTAIFGACYDTDGSLTREAQNGYLLPRVVAIAAPPAIAVPELVVLTEEERQSKYSEIYQLAEELCRSTVVLPEKEKEIQALQMQVDDAMLQKKELERQVEEDKTRVAALEEALAEKEKESVVVPNGSDGVTEEEKERWSRGEREGEV